MSGWVYYYSGIPYCYWVYAWNILRMRKKQTEAEIEKNELELKSLVEQVESLRNGLKGISDQDKQTISSHKQYEVIEQLVDGWAYP